MPGDYLVYTGFGYVHTGIQTAATGYTVTYINGKFQGFMANTTSAGYSSNASASVKKIEIIGKDGPKYCQNEKDFLRKHRLKEMPDT